MCDLNLTEAEVNYILNALADKPYREVCTLIPKIREQALNSNSKNSPVGKMEEKSDE